MGLQDLTNNFLNTKISKTTRPDSIWPEAWMIFFPQDNKGTQIAKWPDGEGGHERVQVKSSRRESEAPEEEGE